MGIGAAIAGAAATSLVGGVISAGAASDAATVQAQAAQYAAQIQGEMYNQTRNDLSPFVRAGQGALTNYASLLPGGLNLTGYSPSTVLNSGGGSSGGAAGSSTPVNVPGVGQVNIPTGSGAGTSGGAADATGSASPPFSLGPTAQSPFLSNVESYVPGSGQAPAASLTALNNLTPGAGANADPLQAAVRGFVPGSGVGANGFLQGVESFIPGTGYANPDSSLTALQGFTPGSSNVYGAIPTNSSLTALDSLLGIGTSQQGGSGGSLGSPNPAIIQAALENTPGYQFTLDQGLKATQNSYASQGLGSSGAAMKGAATFATGLANSTYEQRLQDYLNNYNSQYTNTLNSYNSEFGNNLNAYNTSYANAQNAYGQAYGNALNTTNTQFANATNAYGQQVNTTNNLLSLGENAGSQTGVIGANLATGAGSNIATAGAASAAGIVGGANATTNALTGVSNNALTAALYNSAGSNPAALNALTGNPNLNTSMTNNQLSGLYGTG